MKDLKKYVARKDEIDFSLKEKSGHVVYVPAKGKSDQVPGNCDSKFHELVILFLASLLWLVKEGTVLNRLVWAVLIRVELRPVLIFDCSVK